MATVEAPANLMVKPLFPLPLFLTDSLTPEREHGTRTALLSLDQNLEKSTDGSFWANFGTIH